MVSVVMGRILHVFFFKTNSIANYGYDIINGVQSMELSTLLSSKD